MSLSVFDLFKIGIGPSSSHTVGPMRAAARFVEGLRRDDLLKATTSVKVELYGSLGATGKGHGSDKAVLLGLEGEQPDTVDTSSVDARLAAIRSSGKLKLLGEKPIRFVEKQHLAMIRKPLAYHPNGMIFRALDSAGLQIRSREYYSVGGGFVVDEEAAGHDRIVEDSTVLTYPFTTAKQLLGHCTALGLGRHVRGNPQCRQGAHEFGGVVTPIRSHGGFAAPARRLDAALDHHQRGLTFGGPGGWGCVHIDDQPVPVLHKSMTDETQGRTGTGRFLVEPRLGIGDRSMGRIRPLLAAKVDLCIAILGVFGGHRGDLGVRLGGSLGIGSSNSRRGRRVIRPLVFNGRSGFGLRLEALHGGPGLDERAVDREVLLRQQGRDLAVRQNRGQKLPGDVGRQQPVTVLAEHRGDPDGIIDAEPDEPAEHQVVLHLLHQLPLRAN